MNASGTVWVARFLAAAMVFLGGPAEAADRIRVGIILPLTGDQSEFGQIEKRSFEMAAEEINAKGGVHGKSLELLFEDDKGNPYQGKSAAEKLISADKVSVLTGGYSSSVTLAATAVAEQLKVPFLVATGSADQITERKYAHVFRINPPASEYPAAVVSFLEGVVKPKSAVILFENSLFGQSSSKSFEEDCQRLKIDVLAKEAYRKGDEDFKPLLSKMKAMSPDLVYMVSYVRDAALLMRQAKELDFNPRLFIGGGAGFTLSEFRKNAGDAAEYVFSAALWVETAPYPGARAYSKKYAAKHNEEAEYHGVEAYSALFVVADALGRAKTVSPEDVREALTRTDMMTALGPVKFVSYGMKTQQNKLPTFLVQWQKESLETVWPKGVADKKFVYPVPKWRERQ